MVARYGRTDGVRYCDVEWLRLNRIASVAPKSCGEILMSHTPSGAIDSPGICRMTFFLLPLRTAPWSGTHRAGRGLQVQRDLMPTE